jgi:hypothetical protein
MAAVWWCERSVRPPHQRELERQVLTGELVGGVDEPVMARSSVPHIGIPL